MAIRDTFGTRIELRLGDPTDSVLDRRLALSVPADTPGRGITADKRHLLVALPRVDGVQESRDLSEGVANLVERVGNAWRGPGAPPVRLLPAVVPYASLPTPPGTGLPIGLSELDLQPVHVDFASDPHFLVFGDAESGKSAFLRSLARRIVERHTPREARVILLDYRRSLLGVIDSEHLIGYGTSSASTATLVAEVADVMRKRLPGPDVTPEQLRARNWWRGPDLYLLVDDYDLVGTQMANPLAPLTEFLAQGRDIGLHVVATRRSGGAARGIYEPFLMRVRELATPGLVMSGSKDEGALLGTVKGQPLPPGRGWYVTRREGARLVQLAWLPPA
jgi:S-DNA-T family DNA segregation ATPase FtsK/SpoIIIE